MLQDPLNDAVALQYERWQYPPPVTDLTQGDLAGGDTIIHNPRRYSARYWPARNFREDMQFLVAGCGTYSAACYAHVYPQAQVVGIDVSSASLEHHEALRRKHSLRNLELRRVPIEQVQSLGMDFDFIIAHGVLHHLAQPAAGLRELGQVLKSDGIVSIMVYARYGRLGVYMLQDLFRKMNLHQEAADLPIVKEALTRLPKIHPGRLYANRAPDLGSDSGLIDTFLHSRDISFDVSDCLTLAKDANVVFQGWEEMGMYHPDLFMPAESPLFQRLRQFDDAELWCAMELLQGYYTKHLFHVCRRDRDERTWRIHFDGESFLKYVPQVIGRVEVLDRGRLKLSRTAAPNVHLSEFQAALFRQIDGRRSILECLEAAMPAQDRGALVDFARQFFSAGWRTGYMLFRIP